VERFGREPPAKFAATMMAPWPGADDALRRLSSQPLDPELGATVAANRAFFMALKKGNGALGRLISACEDSTFIAEVTGRSAPWLLSAEEYGWLAVIGGYWTEAWRNAGSVEEVADLARDAAQAAMKDRRRDEHLVVDAEGVRAEPTRRGPHAPTKVDGTGGRVGSDRPDPAQTP
jgi:hypothetical protein